MKYIYILGGLILVFMFVVYYFTYSFNEMVDREVDAAFDAQAADEAKILNEDMLVGLPAPIEKWLRVAGVVGKPLLRNGYLKQQAWMKLDEKQADWYDARAEQFTGMNPPVFIWKVNMKMYPLVSVVGRDIYADGTGAMLIKPLGLFAAVDEQGSDKIDEAAMHRFLAELAWFPSGVLNEYISWEAIDETSARATMEYKGIKASGVFSFDEAGDLKGFSAMRYRELDADAVRKTWVVEVVNTSEMDGVRLASEMTLTADGFLWLKLKLLDVEYNVDQLPMGG
ncbi:MAG: hypothetical protein COC24_012480 [Alphaproteobacteria bacterium]|nr:hypothetical protein [Alphaproteobacteria bacterium]